jgi:hypothetical protein
MGHRGGVAPVIRGRHRERLGAYGSRVYGGTIYYISYAMAASELITFDELRARLFDLDDTRQSAERELAIIGTHKERVAALEADRDDLLASLMDIAPIALESLTPDERRRFYKLLGLRVSAYPDHSLEVEFGDGLVIRERETAQARCSA